MLFLRVSVFPFLLLALTAALLWLEGKRKPREFVDALSVNATPINSLRRATALFAKMFFLLVALSLALNALGLMDSDKVVSVVRSQPPENLFVAIAIAPAAEEVFFRGYLQKRIGVLLSSAIFAGLHYSYGSISEIIAAFFLSVVIGLEFRKRCDLNTCVLSHAAFNAFTIILALHYAVA
ncbi:MAG: CPBP family intramembrane glutamic endopeptidase [Candidatus Norongarragalinales archaeon]